MIHNIITSFPYLMENKIKVRRMDWDLGGIFN
jgi:hypothetical protein